MKEASTREAADLRGPTLPWRPVEIAAIAAFVVVGLWLRLHDLSAEGLGGDEVHKWLAANRYLQGNLSGDDAEHPMLMKWLIALALLVGRQLGWALETITRLPNAIAGGVSVVVVALLGRRLFGRWAGLIASGLAATCVTFVGYQRVAKEDTLLCLFFMIVAWCMAEAKAAADTSNEDPPAALARQHRWELRAAVAIAGMLAAKYFFFLAFVPLLFYAWVRRSDTAWRVPPKRWAVLVGIASVLWAAVNWAPFLPATWAYVPAYFAGGESVHGSMYFMGHVYDSLVQRGLNGTPPWYYLVFTAVKFTPSTLLFALTGLAAALHERRPAHRLVLVWLGVWFVVHSALGGKFGRYYTSVLPAFLLLAAHGAVLLAERARKHVAAVAVGLGVILVSWEAQAAFRLAPHERLYISPLGGGESQVVWFFPHCDYFDAGYREAMLYIAAHAEPGAEVSSEIAYPMIMPSYQPSRLYTERAGRTDLVHTLPRRGRACLKGRVCYVVVQLGRTYLSNENLVMRLGERTPWHVEQIRGVDVVKVYRFEPGEPLPPE